VLFGKHFTDYFTLQADCIWNRNMLTLSAASFNAGSNAQYEETRQSSQQTAFVTALVFFRSRSSRIRPYLSVGTGLVHLSSSLHAISVQQDFVPPPRNFASNMIALRVPVGMDVKLHGPWSFRYSFSENISHNPISNELSPPGMHSLKTFQNLFGIVYQL
jgi:hypothetical protein